MIIDFHTHGVPACQPQLAQKAMTALFGHWVATVAYGYAKNQPFTDHTIDGPMGLLSSMERAHIDLSVLLPVASDPKYVAPTNERMLEIIQHFPNRLRSLAAFHPYEDNLAGAVARIRAQGFRGVKLHTIQQGFEPCSRQAFEAYNLLDRAGLFVLFDTYCHPADLDPDPAVNFPAAFTTSPSVIADIKWAFPHLKIVAAHMGGLSQLDAVERNILGKDIYIDTSFANFFASDEQARRILMNHDPARILFGSDTPAATQEQALEWIRKFNLPPELMIKIMETNARTLLADIR